MATRKAKNEANPTTTAGVVVGLLDGTEVVQIRARVPAKDLRILQRIAKKHPSLVGLIVTG